jgi:2'-5' RNA ligase
MGIRSFLAFELHPVTGKVIEELSRDLRNSSMSAKWVKPENMHITIVFMGSIEDTMVQPIGEAVRGVVSQYDPMSVYLNGIGCFPDARRPRVLWIGLGGEIERLAQLRDALMQKLIPFGIKEEKRDFRPHLTLGRFKKFSGANRDELQKVLKKYSGLSGPEFVLRELVMFKSELRPDGARYSKLHIFPIGGR